MAKKLNAALAFINVASDNPSKSRDFYEKVFGIELVRSLTDQEGYHAPISDDGIDIDVNPRHTPQEGTTPYIAVSNLQQTISTVEAAGGRVVWGPEDMTIPQQDLGEYRKAVKELDGLEVKNDSLGRAVVVVDPGGSQVGLVELADHTHKHFAFGRHQKPLDDYREKVHERSKQIAKKQRPGR